MPTTQQLIAALEAELHAGSGAGYLPSDAAYDVYEGYTLGLLVRAAASLGWPHTYRDAHGHSANNLKLRKGPGKIHGDPTFTHVEINRPHRLEPLEAHVGIAIQGMSGVEHEFDIVVLPKSIATAARQAAKSPLFRDVIVQGECKLLTTDTVPLGLGRGFIGLSADCFLPAKGNLISNKPSSSVADLLSAHGLTFRYNVQPGNTRAEGYLVQRFARLLQRSG